MFRGDALPHGWWVADTKSGNYYHWFCEAAPKLFMLAERDPATPVLIPALLHALPYVRFTLPRLGLNNVHVVPFGRSVRVADLGLIDRFLPQCVPHPVVFARFVKRLHERLGPPPGPMNRRLWISRSAAKIRSVANEDALATLLTKHGFERVVLEALDTEAQVRLCREASILAGPHGAGLTNMLFMPAGGRVLEVRTAANTSSFVYEASILGHRHFSLGASIPLDSSAHSADMTVDADRLDAALAQIIAG